MRNFRGIFSCIFLLICLSAIELPAFAQEKSVITDARAKRSKKRPPRTTDKEFFVPCAKALRIGLEQVLKLHAADITRRNNNNPGDSDTDLLEQKNALKNYLPCRRADTAKKLKKLAADERTDILQDGERARRLAKMRVELIRGISFDENYNDPVNYAISQKAVALVEDYKGNLAWVYLQTGDFNALGNTAAAERDIKRIDTLLARIEKIAREGGKITGFTAFRTEIEKALADIADKIGTEKHLTTGFLVRLLQMNLPAED